MRTKVPDGKGGWTEVEGDVIARDQTADEKRQVAARSKDFTDSAGGLTMRLAKFAQVSCKDAGLEKEHLVFAVALLCVNLREDYPGGADEFDELAKAAAAYYDANASKARG